MVTFGPSTVPFEGEDFSTVHGSPFDRGTADSYYSRGEQPHWYPNGTGTLPRIEGADMSTAEIHAYLAGYLYNEFNGDKKQW